MGAPGQDPRDVPAPRDAEASRDANVYARCWDDYVERWNSGEGAHEWPGDEWGFAELWDDLYEELFVPAGAAAWSRAVEIGPGSGKYTIKVLSRSDCVVRGYDVSARFLEVCETRCADWIGNRRLALHLLAGARADELVLDLDDVGWTRSVDAFFSIDAMVHVDLQYLMVYLMTAGLTLRQGGKLILTLADVTRKPGFVHLLDDIKWTYPIQGQPSGKFEWLSPDILRSVLPRLGFEVESLSNPRRDLHLIATLRDPERADGFRRYLQPPGAPTELTEQVRPQPSPPVPVRRKMPRERRSPFSIPDVPPAVEPDPRDPVIAVVVPVYKQPEYLKDAVASAVRQTERERLRVVIVNDGCPFPSTDRLGRFFQDAFPETVRYLRKPNGGLSSARNHGIRFALTAWPSVRAIFPLDADNRMSPHTLAALWQGLNGSPHDVGWAYQDYTTFGNGDGKWRVGVPFSAYRLVHENYCDAGSLIRREVFDAGIWYDEEMRSGYEDWEFYINASLTGFRGTHVADTGFQYRLHGHSMLSSAKQKHEAIYEFITDKHQDRLGHDALTRLEHTELPRFAVVLVDQSTVFYATDLATDDRHEVPVSAYVDDVVAWENERHPMTTYVSPVAIFTEKHALDFLKELRILPGIAYMLQRALGKVDYATVTLDFAGEPHTLDLVAGARTGEPILFAITPQKWRDLREAFGDRAKELIRGGELVAASMTLRVGTAFLPAASDQLLGRMTCVWTDSGASELRLVQGDGPAGLLDEALGLLSRIGGQRRTRGQRKRVENRRRGSHDRTTTSHADFAHWRHVERKTSGFPGGLRPASADGAAIVFAVPWLRLGGVDRCVLNLAYELGRSNPAHRLHLVLTSSNTIEADPEMLQEFATVTFLPSNEADRRPALESLLAAADVVINAHSRAGYELLPDLARRGRATWMSYLHVIDEDAAGRPMGYPLLATRQYGDLIDHFLVISHQLRRWCLNMGIPGEKIHLLPNAPTVRPPTRAAAIDIATVKCRRTYSPDDPMRILFSGRFDHQKGIDRLEKIASGLRRGGVRFRLTLLGKSVFGSAPPSLDIPEVSVFPATADDRELSRRYAEADVLVLPSRWEGVPLAVLEAMAFGNIVLTTRVGAVDEVIHDGKSGFLIDPEQSEAGIVDAFVKILAGIASRPRDHDPMRVDACRVAMDLSWEQSAATLSALIGALRTDAAGSSDSSGRGVILGRNGAGR